MSNANGGQGQNVANVAPPTERIEQPLYLAKFRERQQREAEADDAGDETGAPLYLRRFRDRSVRDAARAAIPEADLQKPLWQRASHELQQTLTEDARNKEISPPPAAYRQMLSDAYLIRHGETQGYSTDSGLTPQGVWQAHTWGYTLAKRLKSGEEVVFRHAATNRAKETAEHGWRGLTDGLAQFEKDVKVHEPEPLDNLRNFQFAAPDGLKDVTAAFRQYHTLLEGLERAATYDRPVWLMEMDRFWRTQEGGGDPITHWIQTPLQFFEPPQMTTRRFWKAIIGLSEQFPGARLALATHSGPIRAFAVSAFGYDPGEPYNTEHVRVKIYGNADQPRAGLDAQVTYRNRVQEWKVPDAAHLPVWGREDEWVPPQAPGPKNQLAGGSAAGGN